MKICLICYAMMIEEGFVRRFRGPSWVNHWPMCYRCTTCGKANYLP